MHKTVHHYLMRFLGGELCDEDVEVTEVAWVPLKELPSRLAYADERRLAEVAGELIDKLQSDGPTALPPLPPSSPRRRAQTHSHTRNRRPDEPARPSPEPRPGARRAVAAVLRTMVAAVSRIGTAAVPRMCAVAVPRLLAAIALLFPAGRRFRRAYPRPRPASRR